MSPARTGGRGEGTPWKRTRSRHLPLRLEGKKSACTPQNGQKDKESLKFISKRGNLSLHDKPNTRNRCTNSDVDNRGATYIHINKADAETFSRKGGSDAYRKFSRTTTPTSHSNTHGEGRLKGEINHTVGAKEKESPERHRPVPKIAGNVVVGGNGFFVGFCFVGCGGGFVGCWLCFYVGLFFCFLNARKKVRGEGGE